MTSVLKLSSFFAIFGAFIVNTEGSVVTDGWYETPIGYKYKVLFGHYSWHEARNLCQRIGGDLAVHGMKDFGIRVAIANTMLNREAFWIGLHDLYQEGRWVWTDGTTAGSTTHWFPGEPNDLDAREDCAEIDAGRGFLSNDSSCSRPISALCEKKV